MPGGPGLVAPECGQADRLDAAVDRGQRHGTPRFRRGVQHDHAADSPAVAAVVPPHPAVAAVRDRLPARAPGRRAPGAAAAPSGPSGGARCGLQVGEDVVAGRPERPGAGERVELPGHVARATPVAGVPSRGALAETRSDPPSCRPAPAGRRSRSAPARRTSSPRRGRAHGRADPSRGSSSGRGRGHAGAPGRGPRRAGPRRRPGTGCRRTSGRVATGWRGSGAVPRCAWRARRPSPAVATRRAEATGSSSATGVSYVSSPVASRRASSSAVNVFVADPIWNSWSGGNGAGPRRSRCRSPSTSVPTTSGPGWSLTTRPAARTLAARSSGLSAVPPCAAIQA